MTLNDWLTANDIKPAAFAKMLRVPQVTVSRYLSGERRPDEKRMTRIFKLTKGAVTPSDFYRLKAS